MRVTVLGYISRDKNILPNGKTMESVGGKGLFLAAALARSGVDTDLITWLPPSDAELLTVLAEYPITIHVIPIPTETINTNQHGGDRTIATTKLDPVTIEPDHLNRGMREALAGSDLVVIGPDNEDKISLATLRWLTDDAGLSIAADIGKYFRTQRASGQLVPRYPWPRQAEFLAHFQKVFMSEEDIALAMAAGETDLSISRVMAEQGPAEIIISKGSRGAFSFQADTNEAFEIPPQPPRQLIDPTGAGDTFFGAYLARRLQSDNHFEAGRHAAMAASMKLNYSGPLRETAEEIDRELEALEQKEK